MAVAVSITAPSPGPYPSTGRCSSGLTGKTRLRGRSYGIASNKTGTDRKGHASQCSCIGDFHFIEKAKGIKYLYAWLDRHPDVHDTITVEIYLLSSLFEYSVVRQSDSIIFREPVMHQPDSERPDIRSMAKKAATVFKQISQDEKRESAFVFNDNFTGIIRQTGLNVV
jgi:hypothetical protein